jgi:hypothetical protein
MLLEVNPQSLHATTNDGDGLLDLATKHSTKSHPNYALIDDLRRRLQLSPAPHHLTPNRVSSDDTNDDTHSTKGSSPAGRVMGAAAVLSGPNAQQTSKRRKRKRTVTADDDVKTMIDNTQEQANLLLQFSRRTHDDIKNFASV